MTYLIRHKRFPHDLLWPPCQASFCARHNIGIHRSITSNAQLTCPAQAPAGRPAPGRNLSAAHPVTGRAANQAPCPPAMRGYPVMRLFAACAATINLCPLAAAAQPAAPRSFAPVIRQVAPAVVNIGVRGSVAAQRNPFDDRLPALLPATRRRATRARIQSAGPASSSMPPAAISSPTRTSSRMPARIT